jgi:hypothetical protein
MQTIKFLNSNKDTPFEELRGKLYKMYIKSGHPKEMDGRMILYPGSRGANVVGQLNDECNGLIVYSSAFCGVGAKDDIKESNIKVLACPMPYIRNNNQINDTTVIKAWNKSTKIYKCRQGTNATLYHFNDSWRISSTKGLDMNDVKWNGNKTYQNVIEEGLITHNEDWKSFCSLLNIRHSYAIGFYHPEYHVFGAADKLPDIWINRVTDLETLKDVTSQYQPNELGIPVIVEEALLDPELSGQSVEEIVKKMNLICNSAFSYYLENGAVNLGFIVRGLDGGDILFESDLQRMINKLYYDSRFTQEIYKTSYDRHNYVLLSNYLSYDKDVFLNVFPQYKMEFNRFSLKIKKLIDDLKILYQKNKKHTPAPLQAAASLTESCKNIIDSYIKINVDDKNFEPKILSIIHHPDLFDLLYTLLFNPTT